MEKLPDNPSIKAESQIRGSQGRWGRRIAYAEMLAKYRMFAEPVLGVEWAETMRGMCADFDNLDADGFGALLDLILGEV